MLMGAEKLEQIIEGLASGPILTPMKKRASRTEDAEETTLDEVPSADLFGEQQTDEFVISSEEKETNEEEAGATFNVDAQSKMKTDQQYMPAPSTRDEIDYDSIRFANHFKYPKIYGIAYTV